MSNRVEGMRRGRRDTTGASGTHFKLNRRDAHPRCGPNSLVPSSRSNLNVMILNLLYSHYICNYRESVKEKAGREGRGRRAKKGGDGGGCSEGWAGWGGV